jgi:hypothetical protein
MICRTVTEVSLNILGAIQRQVNGGGTFKLTNVLCHLDKE